MKQIRQLCTGLVAASGALGLLTLSALAFDGGNRFWMVYWQGSKSVFHEVRTSYGELDASAQMSGVFHWRVME